MATHANPPPAEADFGSKWDWISGASLGTLLGLLIGLSVTPIVSIVTTALVALLGGFLGFSDKTTLSLSTNGLRRLTAFALAAAVIAPVGVLVRTNDLLGPSLEKQKAELRAIGYEDKSKEQIEVLRFLRFGILPSGATATSDQLTRSLAQVRAPVLYGDVPQGLCADLARARTKEDFLLLLAQSDPSLRRMGDQITRMSEEKQKAAAELATVFLCRGN